MKKGIVFFTLLLALFSLNVYAGDKYDTMNLISVKNKADISTKTFDYRNIKYLDKVEDKKYGMFEIDSILNKTKTDMPYSISILLFNRKQKNIGYISYCSTKDLSGDYAQLKLDAGAKTAFTIPVDNRYLGKGYKRSDIAYYAVSDDNKDCKIGEVEKYLGLSLYDINQGEVSSKYNSNSFMNRIYEIVNKGLPNFLFDLLVIVSIYTSISMLTAYLHRMMYNKFSLLSWIPILHSIASMRVSFGRFVAFFYFVLLLAGGIAQIFDFSMILIVCLLLMFASILVNIMKCATGYYKLLYLDPFTSYEWQKASFDNPLKKVPQLINTQALIDEISGGGVNQAANIQSNVVPQTPQPQVPQTQELQPALSIPQNIISDASAIQSGTPVMQPEISIPQSINIADAQLNGITQEVQTQPVQNEISLKEQRRLEKEAREAERERLRQEKEEANTFYETALESRPETRNSLFGKED